MEEARAVSYLGGQSQLTGSFMTNDEGYSNMGGSEIEPHFGGGGPEVLVYGQP